jgi:teichuronic acid biosynthesis glycosyltransferase TuaC
MWPTPGRPQFGVFVEREVVYLRQYGIDVDVLFIDGRTSRMAYTRGVTQLRAKLRTSQYHLVHAHYVLTGIVCRAQRGLPIVLTHHGIEVMEGWQSPLCWTISRAVDAVIVRTAAMRTRLGLPGAAVIPAGIDMDFFHPIPQRDARQALGLLPGAKIVLFVGEPRPEKRLELAQAAVARIPSAHLHHVHGQPPERVRLFMNAADVLVLTSTNEGSPNVVKEALACNLPVVAVGVGDVPELIADVDGCHIVEQEPDDIARGIARSLAHGDGARVRGREAVEALSWSAVTRRLIDVYEGVLARRA